MIIRLGKYYGIKTQVDRGADRASKWLCAVVWYRRGAGRLGYLYPSLPANLAAVRLLLGA